MTLYGIGLGPGSADLVTVRGRRVLEAADVVYSPGRLSRSVAVEHVPEDRIGDVDFPMTRDEDELRQAWREAAEEIAPRARDGTAAFVTLGDPNVYSTFGHLRRTLSAFHADVEVEVVPGVSAVTAFTTALGVEISAGASLTLHEAPRGAAPTGPDRMLLFKVTDVPTTHERLVDAGYDVLYGRRLCMEQGETVVTRDPSTLDDRDYYTLAYAEKHDLDSEPATAAFQESESERGSGTRPRAETDGGTQPASEPRSGDECQRGSVSMERAEGEACGDEVPEGPPR
ncbi:cobalt-factor II C(20)-methyltransferase [Haloarchaeobius iranensis]|uniref:Precorrin-2 C20-methyltransferase /cobalt-factor II C20-methyltransferase n=1 Tax=Haloarchaeobius iranensis TaxID=996166 RepID=A0A1G9ZM51_9EURY|nr:cobalt-factor II C(20)-methyltransferase [Haloarchaeobius iranensis]SDN22562.1 precorrin-2 C20-methyltransferase /cobalt-factor II C20-methyltransferase [Haloarchaeobius iranensis]